MDAHSYNGYEIHAVPFQLRDTGEWTLNLRIEHDHGNEIVSRNFSANNTFPTREEAVNQCFCFGRKIIDGEVEGCTVVDL